MENLFVPHKLSIDLMSIGFKEKTIARYRGEDLYADYISGYYTEWRFEEPFENAILAPTWDQAFEWFRNKFDWEFCINKRPKGVIEASKHSLKPYSWYVSNDQSNPSIPSGCFGNTDTYEEAQFVCLQRMIEQVKSIINH